MRRARVGPQVKVQKTISRVACETRRAQRTVRVTPDRVVCPPRRATPRAQRIGARRGRKRANDMSECVGRCRSHVVANKGGGGSLRSVAPARKYAWTRDKAMVHGRSKREDVNAAPSVSKARRVLALELQTAR
eukprot:3844224-Pleurochrysis_carterae.AAC.1